MRRTITTRMEDLRMTVKRFENRLNKDNIKFNTLNPVWDNEKQDAFNVFEMIDMLNELHEENRSLKFQLDECQNHKLFSRRELEKENEKLKFENNELKCALALDEVEYIIADGKKIDIPPYYEFEQRYDSVMHRREYDGYD